jgi:YVTN family beta-propeller protein
MPKINTEMSQPDETTKSKYSRKKYIIISLAIIIVLMGGFLYIFRTGVFQPTNHIIVNRQNYTTTMVSSTVQAQNSYRLPTFIYVATLEDNIMVFNATTYAPVRTIAINASKLGITLIAPSSITISPSGKELYLVGIKRGNNTLARTLIAINSTTGLLINSINLDMYTSELALSSNGTDAFILGVPATINGFPETPIQNTTIYKINIANGDLSKSIAFNGLAYNEQIALSENDTEAYVFDVASGKIKAINLSTGSVINSVSVHTPAAYISIDPKTGIAYASSGHSNSNTVSVINLSTGSVNKIINVGTQPTTTAFSPSGNLAYVANYGSNSISVISTATNNVIKTISVNYPFGIIVK